MKNVKIRKVSITAVFGALAFVLMVLEFPLPFIIPSFIKLDFSEIPALIVSFAYGPLYGVAVCLVKNIIHLPLSATSGVGELANFILGTFFVGTAGFVYKLKHSKKGALIASVIGGILMALISLPVNYFITYPFYSNFMPMDAIIGMYKAILPTCDTLLKSLIIFNIPFTLFKGIIDAAVCFAIYKRISRFLNKILDK